MTRRSHDTRPPLTRWSRLVLITSLALVTSLALAACQEAAEQTAEASEQVTGIVLSIDSPALGRVDSFELLDGDGERLVFDTSDLQFRSDFPASHLSEHQVLAAPIEVTFVHEGDRLVVTALRDAE